MGFRRLRHRAASFGFVSAMAFASLANFTGCGGHSAYTPPPVILSVSISESPVLITSNAVPVGVQVMIQAPTETATFSIIGLPAGLSWSYKESESNPSGLLTLTAATNTVAGTYKPTVTVGSSGQTSSLIFTMIVSAPSKTASQDRLNLPAQSQSVPVD